jgi:hypothetical protein
MYPHNLHHFAMASLFSFLHERLIPSIMNVDPKHKAILLEALEDMMYKLSLQLDALKGKPMTKERKALTKKQELIEELQHLISASS